MPKTLTIFQKLSNILSNSNDIQTAVKKVNSYGIDGSDILFKTRDKGEYDAKVLQMKQQHLLAKQWKRANYELTNKSLAGLTEVKMMYRDADLMDCFPEIGTALDIMSEEACLYSDTEIKLTNGETHTIGELFIKNYTNFEIYAVNDEGVCEKSKVEGVIYRGEKPLYELVLDDKTTIKCTEDHKWLTVDKEWKETRDLEQGDELMSAYEQIDGFGNESLKSTAELTGKYHVHKVVSIEKLRMTGNVYDFVNSSVNKCFAVKCKQGHIISHNCFIPKNGFMVNVTSKSERVKSILQDLLVNRLQINVMLPMICRSMCKYGNTFLLLDINNENGVTNWRQLPVYEIERYENGMENPYASAYVNLNNIDLNQTDSTKFVWVGQSEFIPYRNWQIAHFRLLYDSLLLPYGVSSLQKARRHWRMLSMMEDMMIIYRLERSIERRVFKINVGTIDDADVPAYVEEIANNFKRTPIIDPMTGQLDLKKNILNVSEDFFIPVRDDNASNPIDTLQGAQNMTAMDDIKFVQNKVFTALRVPKSFLNFEETTGDGKNLSLLDVRFTRTVNRMQQALLMELNKICIIHLYLLGFEDELTNFNLTMNNPSSQAEMLELENMAKKVTTAKDAISDAGNGIQLMSWTRACKEIMGWSDKEIEENLQEIRLEKALAAELEKTAQIIKRTKIFDKVDNIYGEAGAEYSEGIPQEGEEGGGMSGSGGGGFGGGAIGSEDFDFGGEEEGEDMGSEGEMDMNMAAGEEAASTGGEGEEAGGGEGEPQTFGESYMNGMLKNLINEQRDIQKDIVRKSKNYTKRLNERRMKYENKNRVDENVPIYQKNFLINEDLDTMIKQLDTFGIGG